jgi:hypothetical protein
MKRVVGRSVLIGLLMLSAGCKGKQRGPAYGHEREFRKQIAESQPVKEWGYSVSDVRISQDGQKVLVVFALPGTNTFNETVLTHDGFRRYKGSVFDFVRQEAASREEAAVRETAMRERMALHDAAAREQAAADEVYRSNMMASIKAGQGIPPRPPPTNRPGPSPNPAYTSRSSSFGAGSAHIVVTLPNR